ncbi:hypothetical protein BC629DRAFT_399598 [Irpex lacteus]|nr:hypothetical protein BC629DRAFT_399598 [Irpex lacteus]
MTVFFITIASWGGKTKTIIETARLLKVHFGVPHPILFCTFTNGAVNHVIEGLVAAFLRPLRVGTSSKVKEDFRCVPGVYRRHHMLRTVLIAPLYSSTRRA